MKNISKHRFLTRNSFSAQGNQKGIALVMVLVLSAIGLALMTTLIYLVTVGTQVSGVQKRYKTALEAGMGGKDIVLQVVSMKDKDFTDIEGLFTAMNAAGAGITAAITTAPECKGNDAGLDYEGLQTKLRASFSTWSAECGLVKTLTIDPTVASTYDMKFRIGSGIQYDVYARIADTVSGSPVGNDAGLRGAGVVNNQGETIEVAGIPNLYTIEVLTENSANSQEKAKLQILYQY